MRSAPLGNRRRRRTRHAWMSLRAGSASASIPRGGGIFIDERFTKLQEAEARFKTLTIDVDKGYYDEICLDDEIDIDDINMIDFYPPVEDEDADAEGGEEEKD